MFPLARDHSLLSLAIFRYVYLYEDQCNTEKQDVKIASDIALGDTPSYGSWVLPSQSKQVMVLYEDPSFFLFISMTAVLYTVYCIGKEQNIF